LSRTTDASRAAAPHAAKAPTATRAARRRPRQRRRLLSPLFDLLAIIALPESFRPAFLTAERHQPVCLAA